MPVGPSGICDATVNTRSGSVALVALQHQSCARDDPNEKGHNFHRWILSLLNLPFSSLLYSTVHPTMNDTTG